jgi:hypothetical protein
MVWLLFVKQHYLSHQKRLEIKKVTKCELATGHTSLRKCCFSYNETITIRLALTLPPEITFTQ